MASERDGWPGAPLRQSSMSCCQSKSSRRLTTGVCPIRGRPRFFRISTSESDMRRVLQQSAHIENPLRDPSCNSYAIFLPLRICRTLAQLSYYDLRKVRICRITINSPHFAHRLRITAVSSRLVHLVHGVNQHERREPAWDHRGSLVQKPK